MSTLYLRPQRLDDSLQELAKWGDRARLLAGGTDLLVRMRQGVVEPEVIIDLGALRDLSGIYLDKDQVSIGALTTYGDIERCRELATWAPVLLGASREVGAPQIRSRGTIGGNLANASPAGDSLPPLYVLDAVVHLISVQGERWVPVGEFFTGPGKTVRRPDELIRQIRFPAFEEGERGYFRKIGQRRGMFIAKVSVAATLILEEDTVRDCHIALGAVAPTVIRVQSAEQFIVGKKLTSEAIQKAGELAMETSRPISDIRSTARYRRRMVGVLVERSLRALGQQSSN